MTSAQRRQALLRGAGSILYLWPTGDRGAVGRERAVARRSPPPDVPPVRVGAGHLGSENLELAGVIAHARLLAAHPELAAARPDAVRSVSDWLDYYAALPPISRRVSPVGGLQGDADRLAVDRYRVRQRLVIQGRALIAPLLARRPA